MRGEVELRGQRSDDPLSWSAVSSLGQLEQRERVAAGLDDEPLGDLLGGRGPQVRAQQRPCRVRVEPGQRASREGPAGRTSPGAIPGPEDHDHPVRAEPARAEEQRPGRGRVQPVRVVDDAQRPAFSSAAAVSSDKVATPTRNGSTDGPSSSPNATRRARACGAGSASRSRLTRAQQAVERRERQRRLGLQALGAQHGRVSGLPGRARRAGPIFRRPARPGPRHFPPSRGAPRSTSAPRRARSGSRPTSTRRPYTLRTHRGRSNPANLTGATRAVGREAERRHPTASACAERRPAPRRQEARHATPHTTPTLDTKRRAAAPDRAASLRRRRGAGRRRSLGGALLLDAGAPRGRVETSRACHPTAGLSEQPRTWFWARTTRSTTPPTLDVLIHPGGPGTRPMLRDHGHLDWVREQRPRSR